MEMTERSGGNQSDCGLSCAIVPRDDRSHRLTFYLLHLGMQRIISYPLVESAYDSSTLLELLLFHLRWSVLGHLNNISIQFIYYLMFDWDRLLRTRSNPNSMPPLIPSKIMQSTMHSNTIIPNNNSPHFPLNPHRNIGTLSNMIIQEFQNHI